MNRIEINVLTGEQKVIELTQQEVNQANINTEIENNIKMQILAKEEQERLMSVRKVKENLIKRLKSYVNLAVEAFGIIKPKAVGKSLDLGDLKVWQKKTEALDVTGEIDDARFCNKHIKFELSYEETKKVLQILTSSDYKGAFPIISIIPLKDKLKQWLIDNEEEHKKTISEYKEKVNTLVPTTPNVNLLTPDIKILLNTDLKHNSTVIFK